jgi:hypothetical protein
MKAFFGVAALLVTVALVGLFLGRQFKEMRAHGAAMAAASAASSTASAPTVEALPQQVRGEVLKALEQGAREEPNPR